MFEQRVDCGTTEALEKLSKVRQKGALKKSLINFNDAVAECVHVSPEEKLKYSAEGPHPEICVRMPASKHLRSDPVGYRFSG